MNVIEKKSLEGQATSIMYRNNNNNYKLTFSKTR